MNWQEVIDHPSLQDLPFKIELNEYGAIVMTPIKVKHSFYMGEIAGLIGRMRQDGIGFVQCAIQTSEGTKVADVAWASSDRAQKLLPEADASIAPEICVEVVSASYSEKELREKRQLYLEHGAREVWMCDQHGFIRFFDVNGSLDKSNLFPDFPPRIEI